MRSSPSSDQEDPLCLAFANTGAARPGDEPPRDLTSYNNFIGWVREADALGAGDATRLLEAADRAPEAAEEALGRAVRLRDATATVFRSLARGRAVEPGDLDVLDREWREARARLRLVRRGSRFAAQFPPGASSPERPLWTLASSAADLLLSDRLDRVEECDAPGCTHLFLDTSRNRSRRWCDMAICGNRMKARRHYRRQREG